MASDAMCGSPSSVNLSLQCPSFSEPSRDALGVDKTDDNGHRRSHCPSEVESELSRCRLFGVAGWVSSGA